jgi:hypothetical protein
MCVCPSAPVISLQTAHSVMDLVLQVILKLRDIPINVRHELIDVQLTIQLIAALQKVENSVVLKQFN